MKTKLTELLGLKHPIIQGGMANISDASLASAVSNAGGLGVVAAGTREPGYVREQLQETKRLTDRPFGLNIMLLSPHAEEMAHLAAQEGVAAVTTGAGSPGQYIPMWKEAGIKVIPVVASCALAYRMQRAGADAIIAEGMESGGHIGELTTMALVPQVVDAVSIPVIAAGGIADGRGLAAALMLGACGVQMGTRFLCAKECTVSDAYKQKVINAKDTDTAISGRVTGHPVRCLKNKLLRAMLEAERNGITAEEFQALGAGALLRAVEGDVEHGSLMAGEIAGLVKRTASAKEIIDETAALADELTGGRYSC